MRFVRFENGSGPRYGVVRGEKVAAVKGDIFESYEVEDEVFDLEEVRLLAPCEPSKVVAIGLNYHDHAKEFGRPVPPEPMIFLKPTTSIVGPGDEIIYPPQCNNLHYEAELAIVIGRTAKNTGREKALDYIFGYTVANDVTARDLQKKDHQWGRAKGFDTFCPLGPWIETEISDPNNLDIRLVLNDEIRQDSNTRELIYNVQYLVDFISGIMTLLPGDIILTGTPGGIGPMQVGDRVEVSIEGIGSLQNVVAAPK